MRKLSSEKGSTRYELTQLEDLNSDLMLLKAQLFQLHHPRIQLLTEETGSPITSMLCIILNIPCFSCFMNLWDPLPLWWRGELSSLTVALKRQATWFKSSLLLSSYTYMSFGQVTEGLSFLILKMGIITRVLSID